MILIGTFKLSEQIIKQLGEFKEKDRLVSLTLTWLKKQDFTDNFIVKQIEQQANEIEKDKIKVIYGIKQEARNNFPNGKKMAISYNLGEVRIYG